jgi:hypothetical protein
LSAAGLHLKPEKCEFYQKEVKYLGLIIGADGIKMDPEKIAAVRDWPVPRKIRDVRSFLGFANFYRRFIRGYSEVVRPSTAGVSTHYQHEVRRSLSQTDSGCALLRGGSFLLSSSRERLVDEGGVVVLVMASRGAELALAASVAVSTVDFVIGEKFTDPQRWWG